MRAQQCPLLLFAIGSMLFRELFFVLRLYIACAVTGTFSLFLIANLISQDQMAYSACLFRHKSADYCRLIVSGR